jgi:O-antigen/teichoic acid export membrane protein
VATPTSGHGLRVHRLARVRFVRDAAFTGGAQIVHALGAMLAGIIVARTLGPVGTGTISVVVALGSIGVLLATLGVHQSSIYFMSRPGVDADAVMSNAVAFGLFGGAAAAVGLAAAGAVFHHQLLDRISIGVFLLYVAAVPFSYFTEFARRIVLGRGRIAMFTSPDLVEGIVLLVGTAAVLLSFGSHLVPLIAVRVLIEVSIAVSMAVYLLRSLRFAFRPSPALLRRQVAYGLRSYAGSLLWVVLLQSDLILCNAFLGSGQAGVYSVAVSLGLPVTLLAGVIGTLTFQRATADPDRSSRVANANRVLRLLIPITIVSAAVLALASSWLVDLLYGSDFHASVGALVLLLPGLCALTVETVLMNFLAAEGNPPIVFVAPLIGVAFNLGANVLVIPRYGIDGAAVTSSIGYLLVFGLVARFYLRSTGSPPRALVRRAEA